jgi:cell division protein FtsB
MNMRPHFKDQRRDKLLSGVALLLLLTIGGLALIGPSGVLAWGEQSSRLDDYHRQIAQLQAERDELQNRVDLLDPRNADPDYASELVRGQLNVMHPDEYVVEMDQGQ